MSPDWRTRITRSLALLVAALVAGLAPIVTAGASLQSATVQITSVETGSWPAISATVTVVDASGQPITGLGARDFSATLGGEHLELTGLQTTSDPGIGVAVVLAFDVSGSMEGLPLESARAAGQALIAQLGPSDQAAILTFADQPAVIQSFTADKSILADAVNGLVAGGNTSLYASVEESVNLANSATLSRRAIVLLSDGSNFGVEEVDPAPSLQAVSESSVLFMSIGLGDAIDQVYLSQVATLGRGQFSVAPAPQDLTALYTAAANVLRQQYVLALDAATIDPQLADGSALSIQVAVGGGLLVGESVITLPAAALATPDIPVASALPGGDEVVTAQPEPASEEAGTPLLLYAGAALAVGGALVAGGVVWRHRRPSVKAPPTKEEDALERIDRQRRQVYFPAIERAVAGGMAGAWLEISPDNQVPLGDSPVTVGFSTDCTVMLRNGSTTSAERARIWRREGNYMLHNLSRAGGISVAGRPVTWVVLEDGDEIDIGGCTLHFRDTQTGDTEKI